MNIITWNVNGYRAILKKDFKISVQNLSPDILCLQEIKAKTEQVTREEIEIPGYQSFWNSAIRPGYSGVATYVKDTLGIVQTEFGLGSEEFDGEGRVIRTSFDNNIIFNIYFPNGQRGMDRVDFKLRFYEMLLNICNIEHKAGKNIIITGDFNTAHNEIDLANPKENSKISGFLPEERAWVTKFIDNGFSDAYRVLYPERVQYTWWTYRVNARKRGIGWRLDYFLVSNGMMGSVKDVIVYDQVEGSDHCPVSLLVG